GRVGWRDEISPRRRAAAASVAVPKSGSKARRAGEGAARRPRGGAASNTPEACRKLRRDSGRPTPMRTPRFRDDADRYNPAREGSPTMRLDRRRFLAALGASAAFPAILRSATTRKRLPIAFSTLGCPGWEWKTVLDTADRLGYAALELRGVKGEMDLPTVPELSGTRLAGSKRDLAALGLVVSDLG